MRAAALVFAAAFAALAILNALGTLQPLDAWAVRHLMPGLEPARSGTISPLETLLPVSGDTRVGDLAADAWLYPASAGVSALLLGLCSLALGRRGERAAAVLWPAAFVVGVGIEVLVKHVVRRPALTDAGSHLVGFDGSLPSGHTLRALLLATAAWHVSRRLGRAVLVWAATIPPVLVAAGWHTPSDVLAGSALALLLVAVTGELLRLRARPRPAA